MTSKQQPPVVSLSNIFRDTPGFVLLIFGITEGIIAVIQSAEWATDYIWLVRCLPFVQLACSHFKLFFSRRIEEEKKRITEYESEETETGHKVTVTETETTTEKKE